MKDNMKQIFVAMFFISKLAWGQQKTAANSDWILSFHHAVCDTCTTGVQLKATSLQTHKMTQIAIPELTSVGVSGIFGAKAMVAGFAGHGLERMIICDLNTNQKIDVVDGENFSFAPSNGNVVFISFYSWRDPRFTQGDVILLYNVSKSPIENRVHKFRNQIGEYTAGIPIFPQTNMERNDPSPMRGVGMSVLNLSWSPSGNTLGFIAEAVSPQSRIEKGYGTRSVIFGVAKILNGLGGVKVYLKTLPIKILLRPEQDGANVRFFTDSISVTDDGTLQIVNKSIWREKPQFSINVINTNDQEYSEGSPDSR